MHPNTVADISAWNVHMWGYFRVEIPGYGDLMQWPLAPSRATPGHSTWAIVQSPWTIDPCVLNSKGYWPTVFCGSIRLGRLIHAYDERLLTPCFLWTNRLGRLWWKGMPLRTILISAFLRSAHMECAAHKREFSVARRSLPHILRSVQ